MKKHVKRIVSLLLVVIMLFGVVASLSGCGNEKSTSKNDI